MIYNMLIPAIPFFKWGKLWRILIFIPFSKITVHTCVMSKLFQDCRLEVQNGLGNVCCVSRVCRDIGTSSASVNYCALSRVGTDDLMMFLSVWIILRPLKKPKFKTEQFSWRRPRYSGAEYVFYQYCSVAGSWTLNEGFDTDSSSSFQS